MNNAQTERDAELERLADALFRPKSVALVGASGDPNKNTGRPQRFLAQHGFAGAVYPINPARDEVQGTTAYKTVSDVPAPVDHALLMVPAAKVAAAIEDCARAGVAVATLYSDGFADLGTDDGRARQQALVDLARAGGVRLVGPNSMGVMNFHSGLTLSVNAVLEMQDIQPGGLGVVSQSGSILGSLLSRGAARGFGFSKMLSIGNESDIGVGEVMQMLVNDAQTSTILLFLEGLRGTEQIAAAARAAYAAGKPVVVYKLGRSPLGQQLAATHSGAMTGDSAVADAFFRANGMVRVSMFETLLEIPALLDTRLRVRRPRVSVMTTSGGGAATVVDRLGELGVETVPASDQLAEQLSAHGIAVAGNPIVDVTMAGARREVFTPAIQAMIDDDANDAVIVVAGSSAQFHPHLTVEPIAAAKRGGKPLAVYLVPDAQDSLKLLFNAGIAAFRTPESCADAVAALLQWCEPQAVFDRSVNNINERIAQTDAALSALSAGTIDEAQAATVFAAAGVPVAAMQVFEPSEVALGEVAGYFDVDLAFPIAVKMLSNSITHKTELGGVELGVTDAVGVQRAVTKITASAAGHGERVHRFLLQSMVQGVAETVLGFRLDAEVGPIISVGVGGRLTEIYQDVAIRLAPVDRHCAMAMIEEVKGFAVLRGFRGLPRGDIGALADAIVSMSLLALAQPAVSEAEINPLVIGVQGQGVCAVDAVLLLVESDV
jgi:acyl-CoA synthetase (NDP forming)